MNEWNIEKNPDKHNDIERPSWKQWWYADDSSSVLFG